MLRRHAENDNLVAVRYLGYCYDHGDLGLVPSHKKAARLYQRAAELGDVMAMFNLGISYDHGRGVKLDKKKAAKYWRMAADRGHANAQFNLGCCFQNGGGVARVAGDVVVTRSIGNVDLAPYLSAEPNVVAFDLRDDARLEFLVLATDGLWDVVSSDDAVRFVRARLDRRSEPLLPGRRHGPHPRGPRPPVHRQRRRLRRRPPGPRVLKAAAGASCRPGVRRKSYDGATGTKAWRSTSPMLGTCGLANCSGRQVAVGARPETGGGIAWRFFDEVCRENFEHCRAASLSSRRQKHTRRPQALPQRGPSNF